MLKQCCVVRACEAQTYLAQLFGKVGRVGTSRSVGFGVVHLSVHVDPEHLAATNTLSVQRTTLYTST
jgi:hypothetical protein